MKCCVVDCKKKSNFVFPKNETVRKKWIEAIKRPDFKPNKYHGLCVYHFKSEQIIRESVTAAYKLERLRLVKGAIPSVFSWNTTNASRNKEDISVLNPKITNIEQVNYPEADMNAVPPNNLKANPELFELNVDVYEEVVMTTIDESIVHKINKNCTKDESNTSVNSSVNVGTDHNYQKNYAHGNDKSIQTSVRPRYDIEDFINDPKGILQFTGLENYEKFMTVLYSLGPKAYSLKYTGNRSTGNLSIKNQLFLTLWKLRRYCTDCELSRHFSISEVAVGNIFKTWIIFMARQWSKIDIWPSKELIKYYMPDNFKADFPSTRIIIDGTEIPIRGPCNPRAQQSTFSYYKSGRTLKNVIGNTPGGSFSFYTPSFGGSISDRQMLERSGLQNKCEPGDLIMADRGFAVQDNFVPYNVTVLTPHFTKDKGYLPHETLLQDRKLSKGRVHVERIKGLLKTYKILSTKFNYYYLPIASDIVGVCVMLCNFKECITENGNKE